MTAVDTEQREQRVKKMAGVYTHSKAHTERQQRVNKNTTHIIVCCLYIVFIKYIYYPPIAKNRFKSKMS